MCGRYKLQNPDWVEADFSNTFPTLATAVRTPRYNVAPGQMVLAITRGDGSGRVLEQFNWGVESNWRGGPPMMINARGEKIEGSGFWRPMLEHSRCAIPADGFYEWRAPQAGQKLKQPYLFTREGGEGFWFAGLVGRAPASAETRQGVVIVTGEPNELVEDVHDRMPAMLDAGGVTAWLDGEPAEALAALRPFASTRMSALPIGRAIGDSNNEGPGLIQPVEPEPPAQAQLL
jgi:putative SOS response-associated peptidase YedK